MQIFPVTTGVLRAGDDLAARLNAAASVRQGDIIVISSKAVATVEGAALDLSTFPPSEEAVAWAAKTGSRSPAFIQAVMEETDRLNGRIVGACPGALLTEVRPDGLSQGTILTANAGLDESNVEKNFAIGWPTNPVESARKLKETMGVTVIISDSCCRPRRWGVTAFALTVAGLDPLAHQMGREDLFGKKLRITTEATADQLATAANFVMGNAGQGIPAAIIRDHGLKLSDFCGWVPGIEPEEDLFRGVI